MDVKEHMTWISYLMLMTAYDASEPYYAKKYVLECPSKRNLSAPIVLAANQQRQKRRFFLAQEH